MLADRTLDAGPRIHGTLLLGGPGLLERRDHADERNALTAHGLHFELVPIGLEDLTDIGERVAKVEDPPGDGLVLVALLDGPAELDGVIAREAAVDQPLATGQAREVLVVGVEPPHE